MFDLDSIQPHKVSRDLKGYTIFVYGAPKVGKTTTAVKFPRNILFGFEKGYNAIPNIKAIPINNWAEALGWQSSLLRDAQKAKAALNKDPNCGADQQFYTVTIDTADVAFDFCEKYVCNQNGVTSIGEIAYGAGWKMLEKEYDNFFRRFVDAGYGLIIISHDKLATIKDEKGQEYQKIRPTLGSTSRKIVNRLCDIIGYIQPVTEKDEKGQEVNHSYMFLRGTSKWEAGSRFKYMEPYIEFNYTNLVNAIHDAIDREAENGNADFVTDERNVTTTKAINFDEVYEQTFELIQKLVNKDEKYAEVVSEVVERYFGAGKFLKDATRVQGEQVSMVYYDLSSYIEDNKIELD